MEYQLKMAAGYANRDIALMRAAFAPDPDVVMYGTGADEKRIGPAARVPSAHRRIASFGVSVLSAYMFAGRSFPRRQQI